MEKPQLYRSPMIDFRGEESDFFEPLSPDVIQAQAGKYPYKSIGFFGEADPTADLQPVPKSEPRGYEEEKFSHDRYVPTSHQKEEPITSDMSFDDLMKKLGADQETQDALKDIDQSQAEDSGGMDTYAPNEEDIDPEEVERIFSKIGASDEYHKYFQQGGSVIPFAPVSSYHMIGQGIYPA
jgi:hypothetical protein